MVSEIEYKKARYVLHIKILNNNLYDYYNNLLNHYQGDSGIDLITPMNISIEPFKVGTIDFNIQCEMIDLTDNTFTSYRLVPRSSISNTSFIMSNSEGIIDAGYRGNIKAKITNISLNENNVNQFEKYFQIVSPTLEPIKIKIVDNLTLTDRNNSGFGSTNNI
jgi:deoxyuridine 5'-triphosphate nucleotidohydrolase